VIYNTKDIPEFALNVIAFRNNVDKLVTALKYNGEFLGNPTHNYILIFVMREITKGEFSNYIEHFSDGKVYFQPYTDISEVYNIHSIVNKRVERLREITQKVHDKTENENVFQIQRRSTLILRLLDDDYLRKRLFGLFDNDYRTFVEVISSFDLEDSKFFSACEKLLAIKDAKDEGWSAFGYRSVIFREIFNIFVKEGYIDKLKSFEYSGRNDGVERSINLDRMILLYLSNNVVNRDVPEEQKECRFISLETLFKEITKFCDNHKSIIDALWQMYNLRKEEKWNHLITFENVDVISYEELQREMTAYENNTSDIDFAHVKITLAGENYLNHVLPHFEFYAARGLNGKGHSLFAFTAEEWCDLKEINKIFKLQRKEITNCCKRLYKFFMDIFEKMPEFSGGAFLKSDFAAIKYSYTKKDITRMYHCERILHSNIGYVNRLRFYVAHIMDEVLDKKGFENDVDITLLLSYYPSNCEKLDCLCPENIKPNKIGKCILVKKANEDNYEILQKVLIKMKNCSDNICIEMPLESCIQIIKACINARLVKAIKKYIGMFGIDSGKQCAMYSESTKYLCIAFMACINEKIQPSGYMDLKTPIDAVTGTELIKKKRKNENCDKDKERHEESKKRHILRMSVKHEKEGNEL
jgi:hypothetical protein